MGNENYLKLLMMKNRASERNGRKFSGKKKYFGRKDLGLSGLLKGIEIRFSLIVFCIDIKIGKLFKLSLIEIMLNLSIRKRLRLRPPDTINLKLVLTRQ